MFGQSCHTFRLTPHLGQFARLGHIKKKSTPDMQETKACANLQPGSCCQIGGDAVLPSVSFAGFGVEEAVEQPGRVEHVNHEHTAQQLSDGSALSAAVCGFSVARREHGSNI